MPAESALVLAAALRTDDLWRPLHPPPARGADDLLRPGAGSARAGEARRAGRRPARRRQAPRRRRHRRDGVCRCGGGVSGVCRRQGCRLLVNRSASWQTDQRRMSQHFRPTGAPDGLGLRRGQSTSRMRRATSAQPCMHVRKVLEHASGATVSGMRMQADAQTQISQSRQGRLHRSALLRQHRLRRPVGLLLCLAAPLAEARLPRPLRHARRAQGRGVGRHALPPRQQGEGGGVLPRRHDAGDAPPGRAGAPGLPGHHLLRLQAGRERWR